MSHIIRHVLDKHITITPQWPGSARRATEGFKELSLVPHAVRAVSACCETCVVGTIHEQNLPLVMIDIILMLIQMISLHDPGTGKHFFDYKPVIYVKYIYTLQHLPTLPCPGFNHIFTKLLRRRTAVVNYDVGRP